MVKRDKVVDERGRNWIVGRIGSDEYFAEALRSARAQAERSVRAKVRQTAARRRAA